MVPPKKGSIRKRHKKKGEDFLSIKDCSLIFNKMNLAFAYSKFVYNRINIPVDCIILDVNLAFEKLLKLDKNQILGKKFSLLILGLKKEKLDWIKFCHDISSGKRSVAFDRDISLNKRWYKIKAFSPKKGYLATLLLDITDQKESEKRFRDLFETAGDVILTLNEKGVITNVNQAVERYGLKKKDMIGKSQFYFLDRKFQLQAKRNLRTVKAGRFVSGEFEVNTPKGRFWVSFTDSPIYKNGKFIGVQSILKDITPLRIEEERYRLLFENMRDGVMVYEVKNNGRKFILKEFNKSAELLEKRSLKKKIGKNVKYIFPDFKQTSLLKVMKRVWKTEKQESHLSITYKKDHLQTWRNYYIYKLNTGEIVVVYQDITQEKLADKKLRESEETFRAIFESSTDAIFVHEIHSGKVLNINSKVYELFGYTKKELDKITIENLSSGIYPYTKEEGLKKLKKSLEYPQFFEWQAKDKDGKIFWVEISLKKVKLLGEDRIIASMRDISERKKYEDELKESELRFRSLFEGSNDAIFIADTKTGIIVEANSAAERLIGRSRKEIIGMHHSKLHPPEKIDYYKRKFKSHIKSKGVLDFEVEVIRSDGKRIPVLISASVLNIGGKELIQATFKDITVRKKAEEELKYKLSFENLIANISTKFINVGYKNINEEIESSLGIIGRFLEADRAYIFQFYDPGNKMNNTYEWCARGIISGSKKFEEIDLEKELPWFFSNIQKKEIVLISDTDSLNEKASFEKKYFQDRNIKSLIVVPMVLEDSLIGFLGFDFIRNKKELSKDYDLLLKLISDIFVNALDRKKVFEDLKKRTEDLEKFNKFAVGRELKMVELKKEIKLLRERLSYRNNQRS